MIKKSVSLIAFATVLGAFGGAYAAAGDNAIVTSKAYVDNTKQEKIAGHAANAADSLLTDSETDGTVQKRAIYSDTAANYDSTTQSTQIPTMGAVMSAISSDSQSPIPAGTNGYLATHSGIEGTFGTPVNPATLQTAIPARATKIDSGDSTFANSVVTNGTTDGDVGQMAILTYERMDSDGLYWDDYINNDSLIPTLGAVGMEVERMTAPLPWNTAEQNATGAYNTTFADSGTNVWPTADADKVVKGQTFANAMATKQNKIAGYNPNNDEEKSLLTDTTTDGVVGKISIRNSDGNSGEALNYWAQEDGIIPTLGAIADAIQSLPWSTEEQNATAAYSTTFDDSTGNWPSSDADRFVEGTAFANALAVKQNKISGHAANAADSLLTDSATDGTVQKRAIFNDTAANYDSTTQSTQIPTMGAVMSAVSAGVSAAAPSGDPNTIANYGANGALGSGIAIYSGATQQSPYNAANDSGKIATAAAVETKQTKKVCYGWPDGVEHTDANCWLWTLPD